MLLLREEWSLSGNRGQGPFLFVMKGVLNNLLAEEFVRAISAADFVKLVGAKNLQSFAEYVNYIEDIGQPDIVLRILFQIQNSDGVPLPYYVWLVYPLDADGEVAVYPPDFDDLSTYLETPDSVSDLSWYEITDV
jgi:hypothetical protein